MISNMRQSAWNLHKTFGIESEHLLSGVVIKKTKHTHTVYMESSLQMGPRAYMRSTSSAQFCRN